MVGSRRSEEVVDSNLALKPSSKALKLALLAALKCVDPDAQKRPKMGQVVRLLEAEDYPFREVILISLIPLIILVVRYKLMTSEFYLCRSEKIAEAKPLGTWKFL